MDKREFLRHARLIATSMNIGDQRLGEAELAALEEARKALWRVNGATAVQLMLELKREGFVL